MRIGENTFEYAASADIATGGDHITLVVGVPIRIHRFGLIVAGTAVAGSGILTLSTNELLPTPVRVARQTMNITAGPEGQVQFGEISENAEGTGPGNAFEIPGTGAKNVVPAGFEVIVDSDGGNTAGAAHIFLEFTPLSFQNQFNLPTSNAHYPINNSVIPT